VVTAGTSSRLVEGRGTSEADWASDEVLRELAPFPLSSCPRAVVVAPHPDDETLGLGGTLALLVAAGTPTLVVFATDGERSHPDSSSVTAARMRQLRMAESRDALRSLGTGGRPLQLRRLHLPDGELEAHEGLLGEMLADSVRRDTWCFSTWERDGHPDHEAAGRAASVACAARGATFLSYPVWAWHWAGPVDLESTLERARAVPLPPAARVAKRDAIACYRSQIRAIGDLPEDAAVVPPHDLAHFQREFEVVFA
jgi:LmbE family N-acetylglucosaminyl deacetylase